MSSISSRAVSSMSSRAHERGLLNQLKRAGEATSELPHAPCYYPLEMRSMRGEEMTGGGRADKRRESRRQEKRRLPRGDSRGEEETAEEKTTMRSRRGEERRVEERRGKERKGEERTGEEKRGGGTGTHL